MPYEGPHNKSSEVGEFVVFTDDIITTALEKITAALTNEKVRQVDTQLDGDQITIRGGGITTVFTINRDSGALTLLSSTDVFAGAADYSDHSSQPLHSAEQISNERKAVLKSFLESALQEEFDDGIIDEVDTAAMAREAAARERRAA